MYAAIESVQELSLSKSFDFILYSWPAQKRMNNHKIPEKVLLQVLQQNNIALTHTDRAPGGIRNETTLTESAEASRSNSSSSINSSVSEKQDNFVRSPVRVFRSQEVVTNLLISTDPNFQALHDALIIQMLLILLFTAVRDSYKAGSLCLDTTFFHVGLGTSTDIANFFVFETCVLTWGFAVYPAFKMWQYFRSMVPKVADILFIVLYLIHLLGGLAVTINVLAVQEYLPRITTLIAGVEQFRVSMKNYSFIRENAYKVLYPWHKDDSSGPAVWYQGQMSPSVGSFKQYCYFLFAPTLLYRDHYPRTTTIRWNAVLMYSAQMFVAVWCAVFIVANILYPSSLREQDIVHCVMLSLIMGLVSLLLCNIAVLHSYTNLTAELMRFADRKFYGAWWTCTSFSSFYRQWNLLVHDWIHSYIYLDIKKVFSTRLAVFLTILVSSVVHEYLLSLGVGFVLPIVTLLFAGIGVFFYILKPLNNHRISNLFILSCLSLGMAIILSVLMLEYASRNYCPMEGNNWFKPQIFYCYSKYNP